MPDGNALSGFAHAIQLAIAPVFLLTGIASLLGVIANRLARIIDRGRVLKHSWGTMNKQMRVAARRELDVLEARRRLTSSSITFCTGAALLICLVIVLLFIDAMMAINMRWLAGSLFVLAMLSVIGGLASFLREVYLATHSISFDLAHLEERDLPSP
jgi:amino acid transporter